MDIMEEIMNEYTGDSAKKYAQPSDKFFTLFPALDKLIPQTNEDQKLLDLGCGTGDLYQFAIDKGYTYHGVDASGDMLKQAQQKHPQAVFTQANATKLPSAFSNTFQVVLANMLFPSIANQADFESVFDSIQTALTDDGIAIVTMGHPCFDGYMTKHFFQREDIQTNFTGYFTSGSNYQVHRKINDQNFTFSDHHWTLTDYFKTATQSRLKLIDINECDIVGNPPENIVQKIQTRGVPSYIALKFKK